MTQQFALFEKPETKPLGESPSFSAGVALAQSHEFCAKVLQVFERHPGEWSTKFEHELWAPFRAKNIGCRFSFTMLKLANRLESRIEYFGSSVIGPDYCGFTKAYRLAGTGDGNLSDIEYTQCKPSPGPKQKRIAA